MSVTKIHTAAPPREAGPERNGRPFATHLLAEVGVAVVRLAAASIGCGLICVGLGWPVASGVGAGILIWYLWS